MTTLLPTGPNAQQIQYWNDLAGRKWATYQSSIDAQLAPLGQQTMDRLAIAAGERVLDVGCGCGNTTLELARRVGPTGKVTGIDISTPMLELAREAARAAGVDHVRFENADAQTFAFSTCSVAVVFSRLGVMFFDDPVAAFANLRKALRPGGRIGFVCWQELRRNVWMHVPLEAASPYLPPQPPLEPNLPGPFAFADPGRVRELLTRAGFVALRIEALHETLAIGGQQGLDEAVGLLLQIGPLGRALVDVVGEVRARVAESVRDAVAPFLTPLGVRMPAAAWIVTAAQPA
ncbi:MAG: SAM-dependent methyltransferase [Deltaproteobacteria bacterium]|nr:SAM-dependent methyltransferase [Deltaproteobacteria bacterium]